MNDTSKVLSIIAYYLSKYDMQAITELGFENRTMAMQNISSVFGRENNYLKLRRDEFDVLTGSHRNGWKNRKPAIGVSSLFDYLEQFTFEQVSEIVASFIQNANQDSKLSRQLGRFISDSESLQYSEEQIEQIINLEDESADIVKMEAIVTRRIYKQSVIKQLKILYRSLCQICGYESKSVYGKDIAEAHHIDYFVDSHNNNAHNIMILCPNHHRLIHALHPVFNRETLEFQFMNGHRERVMLNYHL